MFIPRFFSRRKKMSRDFLLYYTTKIIFCQIKSRPGRFPAPANSNENGVGYVPNKNEIAGWKKLEKSKMKLRPYIIRKVITIFRKQKKKSLPRRRLFLFNIGHFVPVRWIRPRCRSCASSRPCPVQSHPS